MAHLTTFCYAAAVVSFLAGAFDGAHTLRFISIGLAFLVLAIYVL